MKKVILLSAMMSVVALAASADEYTDPRTNVVYTYEPGKSTALVKAGYIDFIKRDPDSRLTQVNHSGCPDASGDIVILDRFTVGEEVYVVTSIGDDAFMNNKNIKSVIIPKTVTDIGTGAFSYCDSLTTVKLPDHLTRIADKLFRGCGQLVSVAIPSIVTSIGSYAFQSCSSLTSLTLPASLSFVGVYAFNSTPWYDALFEKAPEGPFYIGSILFGYKGDKPTGELVIKEGTTCVCYAAFSSCDGLTSITFPESIAYVDEYAFNDCTGLTAVNITNLAAWCNIDFLEGLFSTSSNPLCYAHHLYLNGKEVTDLVIPEGVTHIGNFAFDYCTSLTSVTIPNGVTSIGVGAFMGCESMTSVTIPPSVDIIDGVAFIWCYNLNAVHISDLAAWCGLSFYNADNPLRYGAHLYLNGKEVTDLVIPEGVTSVCDGAFMRCSHLTSVTIPEGVTSIGEYAFYSCWSLDSVISWIEKPFDIDNNVFERYNDETNQTSFTSATLYVPKGCKARYEATEGWKNFTHIVEIESTVIGDANGDGNLTVADMTAIAHYVLGHTLEGFSETAADANQDGQVNVADYTAVAHLLLYGSIERPVGCRESRSSNSVLSDNAELENTVYIAPASVTAGEELTLSVKMKNAVDAEGFQFTLTLPEGMSVVRDAEGFAEASLSTERTTKEGTNTFATSLQPDGTLKVMGASTNGSAIKAGDGEVCTVRIKVDADMVEGDYALQLSDVAISDTNAKSYDVEPLEVTLTVHEASGISAALNDKGEMINEKCFDLHGRQLSNSKWLNSQMKKGVYIQDGRKYVK